MDHETCRQLTSLEGRIDKEYVKCIPGLGCWEADAVHLLMAHECASLRSDPRLHADLYKYDLMHAIRWANFGNSNNEWRIPSRLTIESIDRARECLTRASEYVVFCGACWKTWNGVTNVEYPSENLIRFGGNGEWSAYDILDSQLNDDTVDREVRDRLLYTLQKAVRRTKVLQRSSVSASDMYAPDLGTLSHALPHLAGVYRKGQLLPRTWAFQGLSIDAFRLFWNGLRALALLHRAVVSDAIPIPAFPGARLLALPRTTLIEWICRLTGLATETTASVLGYLIFDRSVPKPDISLMPFIPIGADGLVTSPSLLTTLNFERNLCALLAQTASDNFSATTSQCETEMATELRQYFRDRGLLAETHIDIGTTDIDLLVWSPAKGFLLSAELRWLVPTADVSEVFNRGERRCLEKISDQLPKHETELSSNADALVIRAFGKEYAGNVRGSASMLILRGFVGSPRMRTDKFAFCDDRLIVQQLSSGCSLGELFEWCREMPYLPKEGRDFHVEVGEFLTPSGLRILHHETAYA